MHAQEQLIQLMEDNNIPCVIIKGAAAMMAYPYPSLRAVGDVDFLVKRKDYERAAIILENSDYQLASGKVPTNHHYCYKKNGIEFELHNRIAIVDAADSQLLSLFEDGIDNRSWHTIEGIRFPTLPDELNGIVLLFHINQHLREGIGLRHVIDWMVYINAKKNLNSMLPIISKTGMEKLANTVTVMCQEYLGLSTMIEKSNDYPCDQLMEYILTQGNFGRKSGINGKIASVSLTSSNPIRFFRRLQKGGLIHWNPSKKHRLLRPFAWIYQLGYISRRLLLSKTNPFRLIKVSKIKTNKMKLLNDLDLDTDRRTRSN